MEDLTIVLLTVAVWFLIIALVFLQAQVKGLRIRLAKIETLPSIKDFLKQLKIKNQGK
jgi:hypothetical protein